MSATPKPIDHEAYLQLQGQLLLFAPLVADWPLEDFIAAIDKADTLGPIVDPTLWIRAQKPMHEIRDLAVGALAFKRAVIKVRDGT